MLAAASPRLASKDNPRAKRSPRTTAQHKGHSEAPWSSRPQLQFLRLIEGSTLSIAMQIASNCRVRTVIVMTRQLAPPMAALLIVSLGIAQTRSPMLRGAHVVAADLFPSIHTVRGP